MGAGRCVGILAFGDMRGLSGAIPTKMNDSSSTKKV